MSGALIDPYALNEQVRAGAFHRMRQSTYGSYEICPARVQFDIQHPGYSSGDARCIGTAYHAAHEIYWTRRQHDQAWVIDDSIEALRASVMSEIDQAGDDFVWSKYSKPSQLIDEAEAMFRHYVATELDAWSPEWQVLGVETQIILPWIDGWVLTGSLDLVLSNGPETVLLDHKTAGRAWDRKKHLKSPQSPFYVHLWAEAAKAYDIDPGDVRFCWEVMTYKMKFERRFRTPSPEAIALQQAQATLMAADIQRVDQGAQLFMNPSSNLCSATYCDHYDICPAGQVMEAA